MASGIAMPKVLHRYVGPCGLAEWFAGTLARLAPGPLLWLSAARWLDDSRGARLFGTLALLDAAAFDPAPHGGGVYVGLDRPLRPDDALEWIPPSLVISGAPASPAVAARERGAIVDSLCRYLEELDAMRRSGAPGPGVPWHQLSVDERARRLAAAGVSGVWTRWVAADTLAA